jgi:hypothetical protein
VAGETGDDVGPPGGHHDVVVVGGSGVMGIVLLSLGTPGDAPLVWSRSACAPSRRVSVDLP